jgi:hypothetical protein
MLLCPIPRLAASGLTRAPRLAQIFIHGMRLPWTVCARDDAGLLLNVQKRGDGSLEGHLERNV